MKRLTLIYHRNRRFQILSIILVVLVGLLSRTDFVLQFIGPWLGDILYAVMVYFGVGFVLLKKSIVWVAFYALAFCFLIEFGQLINQPWLVELRNSTFGGLVLGSNFRVIDLIMYTLGVILGMMIETLKITPSEK